MPDLDAAKRTLLAELREHSLVIGEVTLSSGAKAKYYVDARRALLRPAGFRTAGELIAAAAVEAGAGAVGGPATAAIPPACAALAVPAGQGLVGFFVRGERKAHGLQFTMILPGGRRGLLVNAEDLCAPAEGHATARFIGQNSATEVLAPRLGVRCHKAAKRHRARATSSEAVQQGNLRVSFGAKLSRHVLPRVGVAPVAISVAGKIATADGSEPPALRRLEIAVNRHGRLDRRGLPICHLDQIQPSTTQNALAGLRSGQGGGGELRCQRRHPRAIAVSL